MPGYVPEELKSLARKEMGAASEADLKKLENRVNNGGSSTENSDRKTFPVIDISSNVVDEKFDFIAEGQGLYFSSSTIVFSYLKWDDNHENYTIGSRNSSGLFLVTYQSDNGWAITDLSNFTIYCQYGDTPMVEGFYDESWSTQMTT